jgi:RHS repeat-associated protein
VAGHLRYLVWSPARLGHPAAAHHAHPGQRKGFILDSTPPGLALTLAASQPYGYAVTDTVYYGQGSGDFTVTAALTDAISGLAQVIFPDTTDAGATYGLGGAITATRSHPYAFDSNDTFSATLTVTATDRAGNQTTQPFTLFKDTIPPTVTIAAPPVAPLHFRVSWSGQDEESGLRDYDVQYKVGVAGTWTSWLTNTPQTQAPFVGERDQSYYFRVQATDNVNNTSAWVEAGPVVVSAVTKYYYHGGQRIAMRQGDVVYYLHSDHLGSTSLTTDQSGAPVAETRYLPYGEERWTSGGAVSDYTFTGQRAEAGFRLMDYNARYYDPRLGRFVSADTVVPQAGNPQALNRYSYVLNRPLQGGDPTGHQGPEEEDFLSAEEYDAWLHLSGRNPEFTYEQFAASRQTYYQYAADPQLYRQDLEVINGLAEGSVEEAWHSVTYATLYSEYVLHEHLLALITVDVARQGFETARTSDDPNYFLWGTTTYGAILGLASGTSCENCGTDKPDLARSAGRLRIDPDGASVYCATCLKGRETNAKSGTYWVKSFDAYTEEALDTNLGLPEYTPQYGGPGHFSVFKGGPTDTQSSLWQRLNLFIRTAKSNFNLK